MVDAFGKALMGYLNGDKSPYIIRRDNGLIEKHDAGEYFTKYEQWDNCEREILKYVRGRVLDIGGGAGRHALYLQNKGFEVYVIDISPLAVKVMKRRGVKNVYLMDLMRLEFPENYFDSILMMFNNFGLAGTIEGTKKVLKVLHRVSTDKGRIITTIRDPYKTDNPQHLAYHERNRREGRPAGQVKIRIEYKGEIGDWFDLLMVPPREELESLIKDVGWGILRIVRENGYYGAVLEKI